MRVEKDIVVSAPVERVYQLWTDFENFPRFMEHVDEVRRIGEDTYHWKAKIGPLTQEWDAEVRGLVPNRTVTWRSISPCFAFSMCAPMRAEADVASLRSIP